MLVDRYLFKSGALILLGPHHENHNLPTYGPAGSHAHMIAFPYEAAADRAGPAVGVQDGTPALYLKPIKLSARYTGKDLHLVLVGESVFLVYGKHTDGEPTMKEANPCPIL